MTELNCIGAGRWGPILLRALHNLPNVRVNMVADPDEERLELIVRRFPDVATTSQVERAVADPTVDAVVIATPVKTHYELALRALRSNKHVLVEKPLCKDVSQCETLSAIAEERGLVLAVGHVFLFNAGIRKIRDIVRAGELGKIYYIHATRTNLGPIREDVNALWDLAAHDLSIFQYWLEEAPTHVSAEGQCFLNHRIEDVMMASYRYPSGVLACVHASWLNPRKVREITIVGDRKMAVWNDMDLIEPVRIYDKSVETCHELEYSDSLGAFHTTIRDGDVTIPKISGGEPVAWECEHFIDCIEGTKPPVNNAAIATDVVRALAATDDSVARRGATVAIGTADPAKCAAAENLVPGARAGLEATPGDARASGKVIS